jgi:hypothetical protein
MHAHSHHYERSNPALTDGIVYLVGSGGGSSLGGLHANRPAWSAFRMNYLHHMRFHVQPDRIDGYAICGPPGAGGSGSCPQGSLMDSFTIESGTVDVPGDALGIGAGPRLLAESNPGRGSVALRVVTDGAGAASIEVHDTAGRLVRLLSSGWHEGGSRRVVWDGMDARGRTVPAGIYLVTLKSGSRSAPIRVTLLH